MQEKNLVYTYELYPTKKRIMTCTRKLEKSQKYILKYKWLTSYNNIIYFNNLIVIMREEIWTQDVFVKNANKC